MDENTEARNRKEGPRKLKRPGLPWSPFSKSGAFTTILKG